MIICPYCGGENIEGADACDECGHSLSDLHLPTPATEVERSLMKDRIHVLIPKQPVLVAPGTPVGEVLQTLVQHDTGCALVVEGERLVGIFSERDALKKLNTQATDLRERPVSEFMTRNPQCLALDDRVAFAVHRMDLGGFRHVPLVDGQGKPVGIISVREILRYLTDCMTRG